MRCVFSVLRVHQTEKNALPTFQARVPRIYYLNLNANCRATGLISKAVQALLTHVDSALQTPTSVVLEAGTWAGIVTLFFAVLKLRALFIQLLCPLLQYSSSKNSVICAIDFISK